MYYLKQIYSLGKYNSGPNTFWTRYVFSGKLMFHSFFNSFLDNTDSILLRFEYVLMALCQTWPMIVFLSLCSRHITKIKVMNLFSSEIGDDLVIPNTVSNLYHTRQNLISNNSILGKDSSRAESNISNQIIDELVKLGDERSHTNSRYHNLGLCARLSPRS